MASHYSMFLADVCNEKEEAIRIGERAFNEAIAEIDNVKEEHYSDLTMIFSLLRDSLTLWKYD